MLVGTLTITLAPAAMYFGVVDRNAGALAAGLGLLFSGVSQVLRPSVPVWPLSANLAAKMERANELRERASIGPIPVAKGLEKLGFLLILIGLIFNVRGFL
jgi:hypothetical protein